MDIGRSSRRAGAPLPNNGVPHSCQCTGVLTTRDCSVTLDLAGDARPAYAGGLQQVRSGEEYFPPVTCSESTRR